MAEEHNVGVGLFVVREDAVVVGVELMHDGLEGISAVTVLEDFHVCVWREAAVDALRELHGAVMGIVGAHESAYEPDHDTGRGSGVGVDGRGSLSSCGFGWGANQPFEGAGQRARGY